MDYLPCGIAPGERKTPNLGILTAVPLDKAVNNAVDNQTGLWTAAGRRDQHLVMVA